MADEKRKGGRDSRAADVEALAARIFAARVISNTSRTVETVAADAVSAAKSFYRVLDEPPPAGLNAPAPTGG